MAVRNDPLVSIVIPVYNGANFVAQAINSALAQTYPNVEVLVVNDGSTDDGQTDSIVRRYGARIRYFAKENGGVSSALNHGLRHMRGRYFAWLSHDDVYYPDMVATLVAALGDRAAIAHADYCGINERTEILLTVQNGDALYQRSAFYSILYNRLHGCSLLIPKVCLDEVGGFDERLPTTNDYDMWFRLAQRYPYLHVPRTLTQVRLHPGRDSYTRPHHIEDCSRLWIQVLTSMTPAQIASCEPDPYVFVSRVDDFLRTSPYTTAYAYTQAWLQEQRAAHTVSVVLCVHDRLDLAREALASVLCQSHAPREIILVNNGPAAQARSLHAWCGLDPRVRLAPAAGGVAWQRGLAQTRGDYVALLDAADLFTPVKIERHLHFLLTNTLAGSHTAHLHVPAPVAHAAQANAAPSSLGTSPVLSTIMARTATLRARDTGLTPALLFPNTAVLPEPLTVLRSCHEYRDPQCRVRVLGAALTHHGRVAGTAAGNLELPQLYAASAALHGVPPTPMPETRQPVVQSDLGPRSRFAGRVRGLLRKVRNMGRLHKWRQLAGRFLDRAAARLGALARRWNAG